MREPVVISKARPTVKSQDYAGLLTQGLGYIQEWTSDIWTDHNVHDPGITLLETLCYAITDLGYRGQLPIEQLLGRHISPDKMALFDPVQALSSNAVTVEDFQKLLITLPDVKYARLSPATGRINGLYDVLIEWENVDLNDSLVLKELKANDKLIAVEFAFPYWDESSVAVWGTAVTLNQATGVGQPLPTLISFSEDELNDYFTTVDVRFNTTQTLRLTIVIRLGTQPSPIDRPELEKAIVNQLTQIAPGSAIETYRSRVNMAFQQMSAVRELLLQNRNLCEDFLHPRSVRTQEVAVRATIELAADADARQTLTDILSAIDLFIDPVVRFSSLAELQAQGLPNETIYEGPLLSAGFLPTLDEPKQNQLYASDILQKMLQSANGERNNAVIAVENFSMNSYVRNRLITANAQNSLTLLRDEQFQPRLSVIKSDISFFRNGVEVDYERQQINSGVQTKRQQAFLASTASSFQPATSSASTISLNPADLMQYQSIQYDLPLVYGLKAGTPDSAPPARKAQEKQLRAYLLFFEQLLANHLSQLANTASFFSIDNPNTYFYQPLYGIPGIDQLLRSFDPSADWDAFSQNPANDYARRLQTLAESPLDRLLRKNNVLEHLLGRFGEELSELSRLEYTLNLQDAASLADFDRIRQATARRLLRYKAAFLNDVCASAAGRGLGTPAGTINDLSGLERRIYRKTGIIRQTRQRLSPTLTDFFTIQASGVNQETFQLNDSSSAILLSSTQTFPTAPPRTVFDGIRAVIQFGIEQASYQVSQTGPSTWQVSLMNDKGVAIARQPSLFVTPTDANTFINSTVTLLYDVFLYDTYKAEGFCLIEHVLLRPTQPVDPDLSGKNPYSLQVTLVFPSGMERDFANLNDLPKPGLPRRFRTKAFRNYVESVIEQECPAHLIPSVFWLDSNSNPDGTVVAGTGLAYDTLETQYLAWLGNYVGGTLDTPTGRTARTNLVTSLNFLQSTLA